MISIISHHWSLRVWFDSQSQWAGGWFHKGRTTSQDQTPSGESHTCIVLAVKFTFHINNDCQRKEERKKAQPLPLQRRCSARKDEEEPSFYIGGQDLTWLPRRVLPQKQQKSSWLTISQNVFGGKLTFLIVAMAYGWVSVRSSAWLLRDKSEQRGASSVQKNSGSDYDRHKSHICSATSARLLYVWVMGGSQPNSSLLFPMYTSLI